MIRGCDISPFYSVFFTDEGIVTQNGEIIGGPKEPGLHFKIPIIQKVHMVNVHRIRFLSIPINYNDTVEVKAHWNIKDSIKFFKASESTGDDKKIESIISPKFSQIINSFSSETLLDIAEGQAANIEFSNSDYEHIVRLAQDFSVDYGLNILRVHFKRK
ncbi:MAG: hypothetical protein HKO91_09930 [Desulfobacterales bacterium]|nr:hypothetical protein [Desulfobacterales bacterium]